MHDLQFTKKEHQCHKFNKSMEFFCLLSLPGVLVLAIFLSWISNPDIRYSYMKESEFCHVYFAECGPLLVFFCSLYIWQHIAGHYLRVNIKWIKLRSDYSLLDLAQTHHNNNLSSQDCLDPSVKVAKLFLWDPSPIIGYPCHSLRHSLTHSCLVNFIDVPLVCENANSKLVEVVYCYWYWCWDTC